MSEPSRPAVESSACPLPPQPATTAASPYRGPIDAVLRTIEARLDTPGEPGGIGLDELAEVAGFSRYHFHRIFVGVVGETLASYIRRLRLQRAATQLRADEQESILTIAVCAGYGSHEAFTRAFRSHYGITPTDFRNGVPPTPPTITPRVTVSTDINEYPVRIEELTPRRVIAMRHVGPYPELGKVFGAMGAWAGPKGLFATPHGKMVGIFLDDPSVTPAEKLRSDAGIVVDETVQPDEGMIVTGLPPGKHAILRLTGSYEQLPKAYQWFYSTWLPQSGHVPGDAPPYEIYVSADHSKPETLETDIHIPLKG